MKVTRKFYERFQKEHDHFLNFLVGIQDAPQRAWFTSVLLNRLMFLYFVQQKGVLNGDRHYLQTRLGEMREVHRPYYRDFLKVLFFKGLAREKGERSDADNALLGDIPHLTGGLFLPHVIEEQNPDIDIPDEAFVALFAFFDRHNWRLDDRPPRQDNDVNPDVLGYIVEKYVNQKQSGTYYTKEDITTYICTYTILPFLLDKIGLNVAQEIAKIGPYVYDAVRTEDRLPTETDREYAARRQRYEGILADFAAGKICTVNDLITYNLDLRAFVADWLRRMNEPVMLHRFYFEGLLKLTVLDPTCGSGAFLIAAMSILEPLYELCLDKMQQVLDSKEGRKYPDFRGELERVKQHPNRRYFVLKSIIVNNLYGVDIMDEAVEICKLRLFLKLVAQLDDVQSEEPPPDIDFNIRAGNTLVGFATRDARMQQTATPDEIRTHLDAALMQDFGLTNLDAFRRSHRPFHWPLEFNRVMASGGFDVIVGNPPYVEYSKVRDEYAIRGYQTEPSGNLYAFAFERSIAVSRDQGTIGLIIPISSFATDRTSSLQKLALSSFEVFWISSYGIRPSKLFEGAEQRLSIVLGRVTKHPQNAEVYSAKYGRWYTEERETLMDRIPYQRVTPLTHLGFPKISTSIEFSILSKMPSTRLGTLYNEQGRDCLYWHRIPGYFIKAVDFVPYFFSDRDGQKKSEDYKVFGLVNAADRPIVAAVLSSSLFYWFWLSISDGYHCGKEEVLDFPFDIISMKPDVKTKLTDLARQLMQDLQLNAQPRTRNQKSTNVVFDEFYPSRSKPIIDEIDRVLAQHYGFTDEELDFIINYDIKYRMGQGAEPEEGEA